MLLAFLITPLIRTNVVCQCTVKWGKTDTHLQVSIELAKCASVSFLVVFSELFHIDFPRQLGLNVHGLLLFYLGNYEVSLL